MATLAPVVAGNRARRPWLRRVVSRTYVHLVNSLAGLQLRYYNGTVLHRTELVRQVPDIPDDFTYQTWVLVWLAKRGYNWIEVGTPYEARRSGHSKAFRLKNVLAVLRSLVRLKISLLQ